MSGLEGLLAGRTLVNRYRIEQVIGRGGFAAVYKAMDESLGRPVAVKVITLPAPDAEIREQIRARFQREARSAASLPHHPNVVAVHDFGTDPELKIDFLVMEFLHGQDLASYLSRTSRPRFEVALGILRDAAEGLAVGHRERLVHRDVKPGNIFLAEPHGGDPFRVCVLDFGIARIATADDDETRLTQAGSPLSPAFASPEQLRGERNLTPASDVYSLGLVGYQLFAGEKPFGPGRTPEEVTIPVERIRQVNPQIPHSIEAAIARAVAADPAERFPDAGAFREALIRAGADVTHEEMRPPAPPPPPAADETLLHPASAAAPVAAAPARAEPPPLMEVEERPERPPVRRGRPHTPFVLWLVALVLLAGGAFLAAEFLGGGGGQSTVEEPLVDEEADNAAADAPEADQQAGEQIVDQPRTVELLGTEIEPRTPRPSAGGGSGAAARDSATTTTTPPGARRPAALPPPARPDSAAPAPRDSVLPPPPVRLLGEPVVRPRRPPRDTVRDTAFVRPS